MGALFVCVNYNGANHTKKMIKSVMQQTRESAVVVVDNASKNDDWNDVVSSCASLERVKLIRSDNNLGYFGGLNLGIAEREGHNFVIVGNNDLEFEADFVERILNTTYPDDVLAVCPNVITADGYQQNPHCRNRVGAVRKFLYQLYFSAYPIAKALTFASRVVAKMKGGRNNSADQLPGYVHLGIGACYILLPAFFEKFKELDDEVFLYGEEAILAGQLMKVGGKFFYDPALVVHHAESATLSKVPSKVKYGFMKKSYPKYRDYL